MMADEIHSVKVIATDNLAKYSSLLKQAAQTTALSNELLPIIKSSSEDGSWRIRLSLSKTLGQFASHFSAAEITAEVLPAAILLIQDPEPDVRVNSLREVALLLPVVNAATFLAAFLPVAVQLADDPVSNVRKTLAEVCVDACAKTKGVAGGGDVASSSSSSSTASSLPDLVVRLCNDEDPLVRLRVLKKLESMAVETPSLVTTLTEALKKFFEDR